LLSIKVPIYHILYVHFNFEGISTITELIRLLIDSFFDSLSSITSDKTLYNKLKRYFITSCYHSGKNTLKDFSYCLQSIFYEFSSSISSFAPSSSSSTPNNNKGEVKSIYFVFENCHLIQHLLSYQELTMMSKVSLPSLV
jgi:hypothetical protein